MPRLVRPGARKTLRLSKDAVHVLHGIRMAASFPVHPFSLWTLPGAASLIANGAIVAFCVWTSDGPPVPPPVERSITVTVLDHDPEPALDDPRQAAAIPGEPRGLAAPAEVPPPPDRHVADMELPELVLRLARHVDTTAVTPTWIDSPVAGEQTARPPNAGEMGAFWQQVRGLIAAKTVYPPAAVRRNASGQVVLRVRVGPSGELLQTDIARSSSDGALDRAALSAVREAVPFPALNFERSAATNAIEALIPVRFELVEGPASGTPTRP